NGLLRHMGLPADGEPTLQAPAPRRLVRPVVWVLAALLLAALAGTAMYFVKGGKGSETGKAAEDAKAIDALAVLPFVYDGDDPKMELLGSTLAGHIIDSLGQVRRADLKVRPF